MSVNLKESKEKLINLAGSIIKSINKNHFSLNNGSLSLSSSITEVLSNKIDKPNDSLKNQVLTFDGENWVPSDPQGGSRTADNVIYDNTDSEFVSDNVQGAIDEISEKFPSIALKDELLFTRRLLNGMETYYNKNDIIYRSTDMYVSPDGNDETGDGSSENPFKTIGYVLSIINRSNEVKVDDYRYNLYVSPGIYNEIHPIQVKSKGVTIKLQGDVEIVCSYSFVPAMMAGYGAYFAIDSFDSSTTVTLTFSGVYTNVIVSHLSSRVAIARTKIIAKNASSNLFAYAYDNSTIYLDTNGIVHEFETSYVGTSDIVSLYALNNSVIFSTCAIELTVNPSFTKNKTYAYSRSGSTISLISIEIPSEYSKGLNAYMGNIFTSAVTNNATSKFSNTVGVILCNGNFIYPIKVEGNITAYGNVYAEGIKTAVAGTNTKVYLQGGNATKCDTEGHNEGVLRLYGWQTTTSNSKYRVDVWPVDNLTANRSIRFPNAAGTISVSSSDVRLKENIENTYVDALGIINQINVRQFDWKKDTNYNDKCGKHQSIGFIADELEELDSEFIVEGSGGYDDEGNVNPKCIDDFYLSGYIIKAIQQLSEENKKLKEKVEILESKMF